MDHTVDLLHTDMVICEMSGSFHVLVATHDPGLIGMDPQGLDTLASEVASIDGVPVEVLQDAIGNPYYHDPKTGKTYRQSRGHHLEHQDDANPKQLMSEMLQ